MRIIDVVRDLLPLTVGHGSLPLLGGWPPLSQNPPTCPTWPADIFAVVGTIIDRSGCYTQFSPDTNNLSGLETYLDEVDVIAKSWTKATQVPSSVIDLWTALVVTHANVTLEDINNNKVVLDTLLKLFAVSDEVCEGMGWGKDGKQPTNKLSVFVRRVLANAVPNAATTATKLPHWPKSLCQDVSPEHVIVLPKSITADKGCTIRSLSHNLALVSCHTKLDPEWRLVSHENDDDSGLRLLLVPFPYVIPASSFSLASKREDVKNKTTLAAFFKLDQNWLNTSTGSRITGATLANDLIVPLIEEATRASGGLLPHGVILPECALDEDTTVELAQALKRLGIEFLITGVLEGKPLTNRPVNLAYTLFLNSLAGAPQSKHHRWRIDEGQAASYGLTFSGDDPANRQWWEDIDVTERRLPFYAFRKDMSLVTLICEDLARMEPAMNAIRAVGPNLVVALLMDGPQLGSRWPGRYASVLADEPGCSVLSLTCAATVDLSNAHYQKGTPSANPKRIVARWTQSKGNTSYDIEMNDGANGVLLTLKSEKRHQTTLDNRSDQSQSRELLFDSVKSLVAGQRPA